MIFYYKITDKFKGLKIPEYLDYFHVGKNKRKSIKILVNNMIPSTNQLLEDGDILSLDDNSEPTFVPWDKKLDVIYEDKHLLVVNKPFGLIVHPDGVNNNYTLANMVSAYYQKTHQNISVKVVHRIDTDTTGIVIFPKDVLMHSYLSNLIEENKFHRSYLLVCSGKFDSKKGTFNYPIAEDRHIANKKRVSPTGKEAITHYEVVEQLKNNLNIVRATLETGRTHQVRLHFSYSGHPLVGDKLYNGNTNILSRQALHSYSFEFVNPFDDKLIGVKCDLPLDMKELIKKHK